jgi:uncharacterized coiled-coil DUF342 family protein
MIGRKNNKASEPADVDLIVEEKMRGYMKDLEDMIRTIAREEVRNAMQETVGTIESIMTANSSYLFELITYLNTLISSTSEPEKQATIEKIRDALKEGREQIAQTIGMIRDLWGVAQTIAITKQEMDKTIAEMQEVKEMTERIRKEIEEIKEMHEDVRNSILESVEQGIVDKVFAELFKSGAWIKMREKLKEEVMAEIMRKGA